MAETKKPVAALKKTEEAKTAEVKADKATEVKAETKTTAKKATEKTAKAAKKVAEKTTETAKKAAEKTTETAKKAAEKTTKAAKKVAEKTTETAKKAAEKTTKTAKKVATAKKASQTVHVQFSGKSYTTDDLVKIAKDVWKYDLGKKEADFKTVEIYVKPEEQAAYYVINDEVTGSFLI